ELDDIKGIGPKTKDALLKKLKTVKHIKGADLQELTEVIGASKATIVYNYFHANQ
ncbi:helix-hairpin-helix domain-containing protein, partial [Prevotella pallens]|uniref:helix-hairpin-helix domain-containing protein n=1 Tax=Prevotella pallens TaxID=60133 RepID=UPI001CAD675A